MKNLYPGNWRDITPHSPCQRPTVFRLCKTLTKTLYKKHIAKRIHAPMRYTVTQGIEEMFSKITLHLINVRSFVHMCHCDPSELGRCPVDCPTLPRCSHVISIPIAVTRESLSLRRAPYLTSFRHSSMMSRRSLIDILCFSKSLHPSCVAVTKQLSYWQVFLCFIGKTGGHSLRALIDRISLTDKPPPLPVDKTIHTRYDHISTLQLLPIRLSMHQLVRQKSLVRLHTEYNTYAKVNICAQVSKTYGDRHDILSKIISFADMPFPNAGR